MLVDRKNWSSTTKMRGFVQVVHVPATQFYQCVGCYVSFYTGSVHVPKHGQIWCSGFIHHDITEILLKVALSTIKILYAELTLKWIPKTMSIPVFRSHDGK